MDKQKTIEYPLLAIAIFLLALISPLILIPIEKFFPYPYIAEELIKVIFVLLILKITDNAFQIKLVIFFGLLFSLSESIFYLPNFDTQHFLFPFLGRFLLTSSLHIFTIFVILIPAKIKRWFILFSVPLAMLAHYLYNIFVVKLFN
jgi:hypothetical protein